MTKFWSGIVWLAENLLVPCKHSVTPVWFDSSGERFGQYFMISNSYEAQ